MSQYPPDKLCSNCDYCAPAWKLYPSNIEAAYSLARCHHPSSAKPNTLAMVHPALEAPTPEYEFCEVLRILADKCGRDANWFEWMDQRDPEQVRRGADIPDEPPWIEGKS